MNILFLIIIDIILKLENFHNIERIKFLKIMNNVG